MRGRELVLHAGLPESGTPVLQAVLRALRPQLHELGIAIVDHEALEALEATDGWHRELVREPARLRAFERELGALVAEEEADVARLTGQRPRATVVSSDHLLGRSCIGRDDASRFRPLAVPAVAQVIRATAASTVRVVLHVRRQDRLMELCYLRAIAEGGHHSFAEQFPYRFEPVLDHAELVVRLRRIPEVRRVRVRPIEFVRPDPTGRARDILDLLGVVDRVELGSLPDVASEPAYSGRALGIALDINRFLDTEQERRWVRRFLTEQFPGRHDSTRFLTDDDRARILSAHAGANRQLFARHVPDLAEDTYARDDGSPMWAAASAADTAEPADGPRTSVPDRRVRTRPRNGSGRLLPRWPPDRRGRLRSRYRARSADVLLVSAPGCGSEWLRMLLGIVLGRHTGLGTHDPLRFTEAGATRSGMPRIVAVPPGCRRSGMQRVVVVVRDPRDVLAAARSDDASGDEPMGPGADQARLEDLLRSYDTWAEDRRCYPEEVAIVRYEDLVRDARGLLRAVLAFTGVGTVDPRWLSSAVEEAGFEVVTRRSGEGAHQRADGGAREESTPATRTASSAGARAFGYAPGRTGSELAPLADVGLAVGPGVEQVTFPIDLVYTWVDGDDPDWRATRSEALVEVDLDGHPVDALTLSRHHDHGELRYSLRSVAQFAHFVRRIFIVTAGQVPDWLDMSNGRITVVDHREVFTDPDCLPTFNSHAIESRLHHIGGLAEHYLYMNDDFFFGRPVTADRFFHANGMTKFFLSPARIDAGGDGSRRSVDAAALNTRRLVLERFGREVTRKFKHAPYPQRRSVLFEMEEVLREEFERTAASRIRSQDDVAVPSSLFHYYSYLTGRAVPGSIRSRYVGLEARRLPGRLRALRRKRNFDVLCLNDSLDDRDGDREPRAALVHRFMEAYWPTKSPFER